MIIHNANQRDFKRYESQVKRKLVELTSENQNYINDLKIFLKQKTGSGLVNTVLRKLPLPEMHLSLPTDITSESVSNGSFKNTGKYSYCGPGTKVQQRLKEGYQGVNSLDKACKEHDIYYSQHKDVSERNKADDILARRATEIVMDENEPEYVRKDARLVTGVMGMKSRFGMGLKSDTKNLLLSSCKT